MQFIGNNTHTIPFPYPTLTLTLTLPLPYPYPYTVPTTYDDELSFCSLAVVTVKISVLTTTENDATKHMHVAHATFHSKIDYNLLK